MARKAFTLNGTAYSWLNIETVIVPQFGQNQGNKFTLKQHSKADYDNNAKTVSVPGPQMNPVVLAPGSAEPSWSISLSIAEARDLITWIGEGYLTIPLDITHTWQIPKKPSFTDFVDGAFIEKDGTKGAHGEATMVELGGKASMVRPNGINPFTQPQS